MNWVNLFLLFYLTIASCELDNPNYSPQKAEQLYLKLFKKKRVDQLEAVKNLQKLEKYEKQYTLIALMAEKIFAVMQESRAIMEASPYIPGVSDFPEDEKTRAALSSILENTVLFGDVILRFPDIAISVLKRSNTWDVLLQWSISFSNQVKHLMDNSSVKVLNLVSQELNYIERDEDYRNPYRVERKWGGYEHGAAYSPTVKKKKIKQKRGPEMNWHDEF